MKTVAFCGSGKNFESMKKFIEELQELGIVVYSPIDDAPLNDWTNVNTFVRRYSASGLMHNGFQRIRKADVVFVFNKDGYIGNATTLEIGFAVAIGKPIYALTEDTDIDRDVLYDSYVTSAAELVEYLR